MVRVQQGLTQATRVATIALASAAVLASCSSRHGIDGTLPLGAFGTGAVMETSITAVAKVPSAQLVLTDSELPAGLTAQHFTDDEIAQQKSAEASPKPDPPKVNPAGCQLPFPPIDPNGDQAGIAAKDTQGWILGDDVAPNPHGIGMLDKIVKRCSTFTMDFTSGTTFHQDLNLTYFDLPHSVADKQVGIRESSSTTFGGPQPNTGLTYSAFAQVGAYVVIVQAIALEFGSAVPGKSATPTPSDANFDSSEFNALFVASVAKVAAGIK